MAAKKPTSWTLREFRAGDLDAVRKLYLDVWGYNRPLRYDRWRYFTPLDQICPGIVAVDGDRLAGAYFLWPARFRIGTEIILGAQAMDVMTHPANAGEGVFEQMALVGNDAATQRGIEVLYGYPAKMSFPGFVGRLNWDYTGDASHWVRPIKISRHPRIPKLLGLPADFGAGFLPKGRTGVYQVATGRPAAAELEELLIPWTRKRRLCRVERDAGWFDWRYGEDSLMDFEFVSAHEDGKLAAMAVWGMRSPEWRGEADKRAHLTELMGGGNEAMQAVLRQVIESASKRGAALLETVTSIDQSGAPLKGCGFFKYGKIPFIVRGLTARTLAANIHNHSSWRLTGGDVDTF